MLHRLPKMLVAAALFVSASSLSAAEWGNLKGRIVFDGKAPSRALITADKDVEVCSAHKIFDDSLVVGENGGIANVVVYVRARKIDIHPDYDKEAGAKVVLDNLNCVFEPRVAGLWTKNTLVIKNSDAVSHNAKIEAFSRPINPLVPAHSQIEENFTQEEAIPAEVSCSIHPWMKGYVVIRSNPYFAITDKDGNFEIKNLPAGENLEFQFWHEKSGYLKDAKFAKEKADTRGRLKVKLATGDNDLGEAKLPAKLFDK